MRIPAQHVVVALLVAAGCDAPDAVPTKPVPGHVDAPGPPKATEKVPATKPEPAQVAAEASPPTPQPDPIDPPGAALSWTVPSCRLTYQYRGRMGSVDELAEILIDFEFTVSADPKDPETIVMRPIKNVRARQTMEGKLIADPIVLDADELLAPHVVSEGKRMKEVDGVTPLWSAYQTLPLQVFWPSLPAAEPGATRTWLIRSNQGNPELDRTAAARGKLELPEDWKPPGWKAQPPVESTIRFTKWTELKGQQVAIVDAAFAGPVPGMEEDKAEVELTGHYRVLGSGRLLDGSVEMILKFEDGDRPLIRLFAEVGLEKACDGPTVRLEPFLPRLEKR